MPALSEGKDEVSDRLASHHSLSKHHRLPKTAIAFAARPSGKTPLSDAGHPILRRKGYSILPKPGDAAPGSVEAPSRSASSICIGT